MKKQIRPFSETPTDGSSPEITAWNNFMATLEEDERKYWAGVVASVRAELKQKHPNIPVGDGAIGGMLMCLVAKGFVGKFEKKLPEMTIVVNPKRDVVYPVGQEG